MFDLSYEIEKLSENIMMGIAWRLHKKLVMWCAIRVFAHATTGKYSSQIVPELTVTDALKRWDTA
jgi:hypothetical protein